MSEDQTFVEHVSAHAFARTLEKVENAITQAGLTIFARIDHAAAARTVGIREGEDGLVRVGFHPIVALLRDAGVPDEDAARLAPAQALVVEDTKP